MSRYVLSGGTLVDGTGAPARVADVLVDGGRVVGVGDVDTTGARRVDVGGLVVAPGFVDVHTHYDAQVLWEPACTPSPLHGVTTVIAGNCGFTLAQAGPEHAGYLLPLLARVEGIPIETLEAGVDWSWRNTAEYFDRIDGLVMNAGFLAGHSAIRCAAMGDRAVGETATDDDLAAMESVLREALTAGALGFSSSNAVTHYDGNGDPVPSRAANETELFRLCRVVSEFPGTGLEYIPARAADEMSRMAAMSLIAQRPLNWNILFVSAEKEALYRGDVAAGAYAESVGAVVRALTLPTTFDTRLNLRTGFILDSLPGWAEIIKLPVDERVRVLRDPAVRARMREGAIAAGARRRELADWGAHRVCETFAPEQADLVGRTIGEIAAERGTDPFDTLIDVSIVDDLRTVIMPRPVGESDASWQHRAAVWLDPNTLIGASDAGAHLDMITTFSYATTLLGDAVRGRHLLSLEQAVHLLTDRPARHYGLRDRGRVEEGWLADLVVFDPTRIGPGEVATRFDLPGGAGRLYGEGVGIERVLVGGTDIVTAGKLTGDTPGTLLHAGRDTETVRLPAFS
jgi:N-acyl-D-aspartate/D-glutamate deacylase